MTGVKSDSGKDETKKIEKQVRKRVQEEAVAYPDISSNNGRVSSDFVRQCLKANELGDGLLYSEIHKGRYLYNNISGEWMKWAGHHWDLDIMQESLAGIEDLVDRFLEEVDQLEKEIQWAQKKKDESTEKRLKKTKDMIFKRIWTYRTDKGRNATLKFARTCRAPVAIRGDELDLHPWLLPCPNGVIDLQTGKFRDGRPDELMFMASPTPWKGLEEPAKRWEQFLLEIFEDKKEMVDYIRRLIGYSITGLKVEHIFPVLWGENGRNGKGMIANVLSYVLGGLAGFIQPELLLDQKRPRSSAGPSPDIMGLKGLRMAFASETDEGQKFSAAKVKWLTGGEQLVGRYPHDKREIRFIPTHTLFLLTNRKPAAPGDDFAFWERMHLVPFRLSYVNREPTKNYERRADPYLETKLIKEASGILAWLVRGCLEYQCDGLDPPLEIIEATAEYRREEDLLHDFLEDYCKIGPDEKEQATELFDVFQRWFQINISAKRKMSQKRFGILMQRRFERRKTNGVYWYFGVSLDAFAVANLPDDDGK